MAELIELQFPMLCEQHVDHVVLRFKRILEGIHAGLEHANLLFKLILAWLFYKIPSMSDPAPLTISETALKTVSIIGAPLFLRSGSLGSLAEISHKHQLPSFYQL